MKTTPSLDAAGEEAGTEMGAHCVSLAGEGKPHCYADRRLILQQGSFAEETLAVEAVPLGVVRAQKMIAAVA